MPEDETPPQNPDVNTNGTSSRSKPQTESSQQIANPSSHSFFRLPEPIKQIFDKFPLKTYPSNELPTRARKKRRDRHALYVFIAPEDAQKNRPSYNPSCLKWQAYLRFKGIEHTLIPSNNHASPTGSLPFLLPKSSSEPISSSHLSKWISSQPSQSSNNSPGELRQEAYLALLSHRVRPAWLYFLYLSPRNFSDVAQRLYVAPCTSSTLVQSVLASQLQSAALDEILKLSPSLTQSALTASDIDDLYTEARLAFSALSTLLDNSQNDWFFDNTAPGFFDASVFAYTYLILDPHQDGKVMGWKDTRLRDILQSFENLVRHCNNISDKYFA